MAATLLEVAERGVLPAALAAELAAAALPPALAAAAAGAAALAAAGCGGSAAETHREPGAAGAPVSPGGRKDRGGPAACGWLELLAAAALELLAAFALAAFALAACGWLPNPKAALVKSSLKAMLLQTCFNSALMAAA